MPIFTDVLRSQGDAEIDAKLQEIQPFITVKSYLAMYDGVKDYMRQVISTNDALLTEMHSIWSRARRQPALHDLVSDFKRIRRLKASQPALDLDGLLDAFAWKERKEVFLDRGDVHVEVVNEALKLLGADTYGPSAKFASIMDEIQIEEIESSPDQQQHQQEPSVSSEDISKLQRAIKKALNSKTRLIKQ